MARVSQIDVDSRATWPHRRHFLLSCVGFSIGFGNFWRFPSLAIVYGGAIFFIPYFILLILIGLPMCYLEMVMGQFSSEGPLHVFSSLAPVCTGIGVAMSLTSLLVCLYYMTFVAYSLYYIQQSLAHSTVPWMTCDASWGADKFCYTKLNTTKMLPLCDEMSNVNKSQLIEFINCTERPMEIAAQQFFEKNVLGRTSNQSGNLGSIVPSLAISLFVAWLMVFFCAFRGIKSSSKVVHITATFPLLILILMLIVGALQPGAYKGILFLIEYKWTVLIDTHVWIAAVSQVFYSMSISYGPYIMYSSFNKIHASILNCAIFVTVVDSVISILSTFVVYMTLGLLSEQSSTPMHDLVKVASGSRLAYIIYPQALIDFPFVPQLWIVLFNLMLIFLALDCQFALLETFFTSLYECSKYLLTHRIYVCAIACSLCYVINLVCITENGSMVVAMMDEASDGCTIVFIAICELIAVTRCYGTGRMKQIIAFMTYRKPPLLFTLSWNYFSPLVLLILLISYFIRYPQTPHNDFDYSSGMEISFWLITVFIMSQIPVWFVIALVYYALRKNIGRAFKCTADWFPAAVNDQDEFHEYTFSADQLKLSVISDETCLSKKSGRIRYFSLPKIKNLAHDNNFFQAFTSLVCSKRGKGEIESEGPNDIREGSLKPVNSNLDRA